MSQSFITKGAPGFSFVKEVHQLQLSSIPFDIAQFGWKKYYELWTLNKFLHQNQPQFFTGPFNTVHLCFKLLIPLSHHLQSHLRGNLHKIMYCNVLKIASFHLCQIGFFSRWTIHSTVWQLPLLSRLLRCFCLDLVLRASDELLLLMLLLSIVLLPLPFLELFNAQPQSLII